VEVTKAERLRTCGAWRPWGFCQAIPADKENLRHLAFGGTHHPPGGLGAAAPGGMCPPPGDFGCCSIELLDST